MIPRLSELLPTWWHQDVSNLDSSCGTGCYLRIEDSYNHLPFYRWIIANLQPLAWTAFGNATFHSQLGLLRPLSINYAATIVYNLRGQVPSFRESLLFKLSLAKFSSRNYLSFSTIEATAQYLLPLFSHPILVVSITGLSDYNVECFTATFSL